MQEKPIMLVVDDNEFSRAVLRAIFENEYEIIEAVDGCECMEILRTQAVSIVLLDLVMPKMDGYEVLEAMKKDPVLSAIPVVANTVGDAEDAESRALELGAADYITKPYRPDVVRKRIANIVRGTDADTMRIMAETDWLTGIYNRSAFGKYTKKMLDDNPGTQYVLLCWNVERFKIVNDVFGTEVGDALLRDIADMLRTKVTGYGTVGRLESDNFACCFPYNLLDIDDVMRQAKRILPAVNVIYEINVRVGVYVIDDKNVPISTMCDRASIALNTIKGNYLRHYAFYDDALHEKMLLEQSIFTEMESALAEHQFCIYFQPQYLAEQEVPVAAEALVRWIHPTYGMISPGIFIPQFESNGFITKLDYFVWEEACKFISRRVKEKKTILPISVNISRINFFDEDVCDKILGLAKKYEIDPGLLHLEITESAYNENTELIMNAIRRFQKAGFLVAMDDFGSGYSSLNMLKDLPLNILKIDMKFVSDVEDNERAGSVLTSVVRMAKWLEMRVVAEGVETRAQKDFLRSIGCDVIQGYYYSKPLPMEDYEKLIDDIKPIVFDANKYEASEIECFMKADGAANTMFNSIPYAAGIYELFDNSLEIQRVNSEYYKLTGATPQTLMRDTKNGLAWVETQDRQKVLDACKEAERTGETQRITVRRYHRNGTLMLLDAKIKCLGTRQNYSMYYMSMDTMPEADSISCPVALPTVGAIEHSDAASGEHTILIVDDNKINRVMLNKLLSQQYRIVEAENGREALEVLQKYDYKINAVLLDLVMPVMNGFEFLKTRQSNASLSAIPVIVLTQGEEPDSEIRALRLGANDFLKKPYEADKIINRLKNDISISTYTQGGISVQSIINNLPGGVLVYYCTETEVRGMYVNDTLCAAVGLSHEECERIFSEGLGMVDEKDRPLMKRRLISAAAGRNSISADFRIAKRSAEEATRWIRMRANFSHMEGEHIVYYAFLTDVTKQLETLHELKMRSEELENANIKLNIAFEQSNIYMWEHNLITNEVEVSPMMQKKLKWKSNRAPLAQLYKSVSISKENQKDIAEPALRRLRNGETPVSALIPFKAPNGSERWERVKYTLHLEKDGRPRIAIAVARDITDETIAKRRYRDAEGFRKSVIKDMLAFIEYDFTLGKVESIFPPTLSRVVNGENIVDTMINKGIVATTGKDVVELVSEPDKLLESIKNGHTDDRFECLLRSMYGAWQGERWVSVSLSYRISNETGHAMAFISVRDINESKERELSLRHQARRDPLTGLKNRLAFTEHTEHQLQLLKNDGSLAAYYIIDIDNFKRINDTMGHAYGDTVLRTLAGRLRSLFRSGDVIARLGGDEMIVFISGIPNIEFALARGDEICKAMAESNLKGEGGTTVTCSVGIAIAPRDGTDIDTLYRHADHALYCAKRNGKSCYYLYDGDGSDNGENNSLNKI